jgi:hypothetical protein
MSQKTYEVIKIKDGPGIDGGWDGICWTSVASLSVDCFLAESSSHRPETLLKLVHDGVFLHGIFRVEDRYVRCVHQGYHVPVYKDSCVECFLSPDLACGYLNFEFNCGGALLCYHIEDATRVSGGFAKSTPVPVEELAAVRTHHSMPGVIDPEVTSPTKWELGFSIPFAIFESRFPSMNIATGARWRANFYKCADETSHPHWAAWSPLPARNFHLPQHFGTIMLDGCSR